MIIRRIISDIADSLSFFQVVAIVGPRQVGKTTLAKQVTTELDLPSVYLDLELQSDLFKINDAELFFLQNADKLIIIDEVQIRKDLFPLLRAVVDKTRKPGQFLLLGSASPELIRDSSESLAGRVAHHQLFPFDLTEVPDTVSQTDLWMKGGFPPMAINNKPLIANRWMANFISTYLNRDLLQLGLSASPKVIRNLWTILAHLNGQLLNATSIGKSLGITTHTVKRYIDFLEDAFLVKSLHPFYWNISKRLVKSPKIYLTDTGILHHLLNIPDFNSLSGNPIIGSSWEAFVLNQILAVKPNGLDVYFYRTHQGTEADLVFTHGLNVVATAEVKYSNSPQLTKGNFQAIEDLNAPINFVITPSSDDYLFKERIRVCPLVDFINKYLQHL